MQKHLAFRAYNPSAVLLRKIDLCSYEQCTKQKYGRSSQLSTSATPVHAEGRAAVVTLRQRCCSIWNFVNVPDDAREQFTVMSHLGRDGFTNELAQFCEISFLNVCLCFMVYSILCRPIIVLMELLPWLTGVLQFRWLHLELLVALQFFHYADFCFAGFLLMIWPASLCFRNTQ